MYKTGFYEKYWMLSLFPFELVTEINLSHSGGSLLVWSVLDCGCDY